MKAVIKRAQIPHLIANTNMNGEKVTLRKVQELEKTHVKLYYQLLQSLDELYLLKEGKKTELSSNERLLLELRSYMQMSMDKSIAMLKAFQRAENETSAGDTAVSTEDIMATHLKGLMEENFQLDNKVAKRMHQLDSLTEELQAERSRYDILKDNLQAASDRVRDPTQQPPDALPDTTLTGDTDKQLEDENHTLQELLTALRVHTGHL